MPGFWLVRETGAWTQVPLGPQEGRPLMAIGPTQGKSQAFGEIGKLMKGKTEGIRKDRLKDGGTKVEKQQVRSAKPTRKQREKQTQKRADRRRGSKVDVRA